jgi:hypothetical protein
VTVFDAAEAGPVPTPFVAVTVNVYAVPFVSPVTVIGLAEPDAVAPPGEAVTVYELIAEPLVEGAVKLTVACRSPPLAETPVGVPGTWGAGVTALDAAEAEPVPALLVAVTVKVYAVPFVKPLMVIGLAEPDAVAPPGDAVTVYDVIAAPPFEAGAEKLAVA